MFFGKQQKRKDINQYFECHPGTPLYGVSGDYRCSVHFRNTYRLNKAKEQATRLPVDIKTIISLVNDFLKTLEMPIMESPCMRYPHDINYREIQNKYTLADQRDIVWMKFTKDGYLGVVATSNDINFDIPESALDYDKKVNGTWKHNSSSILIHQLGKEWDTSFVLVFPLVNIPNQYVRSDIERAVGNCLIDNGIPILDFYSHNY